ncbi:MAG TPA: RNA polymerase sigma factor [Polyangiaceae bacterium]
MHTQRDPQIELSPVAGGAPICLIRTVAVPKRVPRSELAPRAGLPRERDALDDLVREHSGYVASLAYRVLGRDDEVSDLVQDVFVALFRFHDTIREPAAVRSWLATTTVRLARKRLRARQNRFLRFLSLFTAEPEFVEPSSKAGLPEDQVVFKTVEVALGTVPADARIAWALRYLEQEPLEDVARICGCSLATAKRRIAIAHQAVTRSLAHG